MFEAAIAGDATRVYFEWSPGSPLAANPPQLEMRDDGTGGDRRAGDGVYSVLLPSTDIVRARVADDVQRVFVGYLDVMNGSLHVLHGNIFASVYTSDVGTTPITQRSPTLQFTSRVVNIYDPSFFVDFSVSRIAQTFYQTFGDDYDFLNVISLPGRFLNRDHVAVKNDVDGIGLVRQDDSRSYGSAGRLKGVSRFPIDDFYDGAVTGYIHEMGHQWINFLNFSPLGQGIPHWPYSSMAGGVMGFSIGGQGGEGGDFACTAVSQNGVVRLLARDGEPVFSDFDLYLMELVPPAQVADGIVFADQTAAQQLRCAGQTFTGAVLPVSVQDVIARYGARRPSAGDAQSQFRAATILVSRDGLASQETMWLYSWLTARAERRSPVAVHEGFLKSIPGAPANLTASAAGSSVTLRWTAPSTGNAPAAYQLEAGSTSGSTDLANFSTAAQRRRSLRSASRPARTT
ncbi:MAG: hypothetical protein LAO77_25985 [Acidobacteriia bacterium]|nr:hypothetical protein [Terriglobia bacterium]